MVSWCARKSGQGETVGAIATNPGQSAMVANNQSARHRTFVLKNERSAAYYRREAISRARPFTPSFW